VTRTALLLAACLAAILATAGVAAAKRPLGTIFEDVYDTPAGAHAVEICWGGDGLEDMDSYTIQRAKGTRPPRARSRPIATLKGSGGNPPETCYTSTGLKTDVAYTFRIVGHSEAGETEPGIRTTAARVEGAYVLAPRSDTLLFHSAESSDAQIAFSPGHGLHAFFSKYTGLFHSVRVKDGWSTPKVLAGEAYARHPRIAANAGGAAVVGWNNYMEGPGYRFKSAGEIGFGPRSTFPDQQPGDAIVGLVLDRAGHIHALIDRFDFFSPERGLHYLTDSSGSWHDQLIPDSICGEPYDESCVPPSLLAYDPLSDQIVLVEQSSGMRIGSKPASASEFGPLERMPAPGAGHLIAQSLTVSGGRITMGLRPYMKRTSSPSILADGPVYVMTDGRIEKLPAAGEEAPFFLVAASSPDRVQLAWSRRSPSWDLGEQGVWTAERVRNAQTGRWSLRSVRHRSVSRYDVLLSLTVDARGRPLAGYTR
jgi:hypothetical protein